jgi:hypothetical protein
MKIGYHDALEVVQGCIDEVHNLSRAQKKEYMLNKVNNLHIIYLFIYLF